MQDIVTSPISGNCLTIGIPVRIDSKERKANLSAVVKHLSALQCRIIVLEADAHPNTDNIGCIDNVDYVYVENTNTVFHRTQYINQLILMSQAEIVAIWDTDVLVDYCQILEALQEIRLGATIAYPYDGRFIMLSEELSTQTRVKLDFDYLRNLKMKSFLGRKLCGGAYLVHKQRYLQCGGENEHFTGWGLEDAERLRRVRILGHKVSHISHGELFHLYHPRGINSNYQSTDDARQLREKFVKICSMEKEELQNYITGNSWRHREN